MNEMQLRTLSLLGATVLSLGCVQTAPVVRTPQRAETVANAASPAAAPGRADASRTSEPPAPSVQRQAFATAQAPSAAPSKKTDFDGKWIGQMNCGGVPLRIELFFYAYESAPDPISVSGGVSTAQRSTPYYFRMLGVAGTQQFDLRWNGWTYLSQDGMPPTDMTVSRLPTSNQLRAVPGNPRCKPFELQRESLDNMHPRVRGEATKAVNAGKPLTYSELVKLVGQARGNLQPLRDKTVQLTLRAAGPQSLVVNTKDGILFTCQKRAAGFKGGSVTARITGVEDTPHGDLAIELDRCGT